MRPQRAARLLAAALIASSALACRVGPSVDSLGPATSPHGTQAELRLTDGTEVRGELVAVRPGDLLLETERELVSVPLSSVRRASFEDAPGISRWRGTEGQLERLARFSRYPFGVDDDLLDRLLESTGQDEVTVLGRSGSEAGAASSSSRDAPGSSPRLDSTDARTRAFLRGAEDAADRYRDRRTAIADGFRRLGPDFPGMGVHWVHIGRVVSGKLAGEAPPVLAYLEVDGAPRLVGLAYTLPLAADESPPTVPFGVDAWHDHSGEVDEESLLLNHPSSFARAPSDFRLAMVHLWLPLENPAGITEQNNWHLPFLRAGLSSPNDPPALAARGLSLGASGVGYYQELLRWAVDGDEIATTTIEAIVQRWSSKVDEWLEGADGSATEADLERLEAHWTGMWDELRRALEPDVFERIRPLAAPH